MARHATLREALQEGTDFHSKDGADRRQYSNNRHGRGGNSSRTVNDVKMRSSTQTTTAVLTTNAAAVVQIGPSPLWIFMPATANTNGSSGTCVDSASLFGLFWTSNQWLFIPSHHRESSNA